MESPRNRPPHCRTGLLALAAILTALASGCATPRPDAPFKRDDYFGGHGNLIKPKHHVPREVQRVEPWLPLF